MAGWWGGVGWWSRPSLGFSFSQAEQNYVRRIADKILKTENLHLKVFRLEPLEPPVVCPCLPDQGHAEVELVQVVQDLVHPRHHLEKKIEIS